MESAESLAELEDARNYVVGLAAYLATCATDVIVENLETTIAALHAKEKRFEAAIRKAKGEQ